MSTATFVRDVSKGFTGTAHLWRLDPPITYTAVFGEEGGSTSEYVVTSATCAYTDPETYIFPADSDGKVIDWGELRGSFRGGLDHDKAIHGAGYEVVR